MTYATGWTKFADFCAECGFSAVLPIHVDTICGFVAYLSLKIFAHATIATYLAGVGFRQKVNGFEDPGNCFIIGLMLDGVRRDKGVVHDFRLPITLHHLKEILTALPSISHSNFEAVLFKAIFTCMFFGFLRIGEVAVSSKHNIQKSVLRRSDVVIQGIEKEKLLLINFRVSKNNQFGRPQQIVISSQPNEVFCPISALSAYLGLANNSALLFSHFDTSPVTQYQLNHMLTKAVEFCDFPNRHLFRSHSFRIGAATTAKQLGMSDDEIQVMGRWQSGAFKKYIRLPLLTHGD
jgi:hypothetical protein